MLCYFTIIRISWIAKNKEMSENSQIINSLLRTEELKIFALYLESDIKMWGTYSTTIPQQWINAYNSSES